MCGGGCECVPSAKIIWVVSHTDLAIWHWWKRCIVLSSVFGHHGHCELSGAMVAMGRPIGRRSHVASHRMSEAGRCRCWWKISSQPTCPTLGMISVLGSVGACGRRILRSVGSDGRDAIVFGIWFSIFLQAERLLRRGS
jgi:hypothetical protein